MQYRTIMRHLGVLSLVFLLAAFKPAEVSRTDDSGYQLNHDQISSMMSSKRVYTQFRVNRPIQVTNEKSMQVATLFEDSILELLLPSDIFFEALSAQRNAGLRPDDFSRALDMYMGDDLQSQTLGIIHSGGERPRVFAGDRVKVELSREVRNKNVSVVTVEPEEQEFLDDGEGEIISLMEDKGEAKTEKKAKTEAGSVCVDCGEKEVRVTPLSKKNEPLLNFQDDLLRQYSNSPEVKKMISIARRNAKPKATKYCYRYVKAALSGAKLASEMHEIPARKAGLDLEKNGFANLLRDPSLAKDLQDPRNAPPGAVLVYEGGKTMCGRVACGHVEIKVGEKGQGGFVAESYTDSPVTDLTVRTSRKLIGVYIKYPTGGVLAQK